MPNCDFYALGDDFCQVLEFVFAQPGWELHELASVPDREVQVFHSVAQLMKAFDVGRRPHCFQLYASEMRGKVVHQRITFKPGPVPGATHRFATEGWGLIQLYFGFLDSTGDLTPCHTNHNSEARANAWWPPTGRQLDELGDPSTWDWIVVNRLSSRLKRFIRERAVDKFGSRPVLACAQDAVTRGDVRLLLNA